MGRGWSARISQVSDPSRSAARGTWASKTAQVLISSPQKRVSHMTDASLRVWGDSPVHRIRQFFWWSLERKYVDPLTLFLRPSRPGTQKPSSDPILPQIVFGLHKNQSLLPPGQSDSLSHTFTEYLLYGWHLSFSKVASLYCVSPVCLDPNYQAEIIVNVHLLNA